MPSDDQTPRTAPGEPTAPPESPAGTGVDAEALLALQKRALGVIAGLAPAALELARAGTGAAGWRTWSSR